MLSMTSNMAFMPELIIAGMAVLALLADLFIPQRDHLITYLITQIALIASAICGFSFYGSPTILAFHDLFILDPLAVLLKPMICLISFGVFVYARSYVNERIKNHGGEFYILGLFAILGMLVLVSAANFVPLFLGLELFSLPVYALVALERDQASRAEAAIKYFIIGSFASGILLYGMSLLYGVTGSLDIKTIANNLLYFNANYHALTIISLVFLVVGIAFKFGAVPFHMWLPDVYAGAPNPVTLFIAAAPKIAALAMAIRLLVETMPVFNIEWQQLLIIIAILSMALGNLVAIIQTNIKRLLAYSAISHIGYMCLGLISGTPDGYAAAVFYILSYAIMTLGAFGMLLILNKGGFAGEEIADLRGLNSKNPWLAFMMLLLMFSMAGIPPLVGFSAKLGVLEALVQVHNIWLPVFALLCAIVGAYYYLNIVRVMYFEDPIDLAPISCPLDMKVAITVNGFMVLLLGLFPGALFAVCHALF